MADNSGIARMLSLLSANLMAEVETHNAGNWENEDTIRLYECLQTAIYVTQVKVCPNYPELLSRPVIDPTKLLKN